MKSHTAFWRWRWTGRAAAAAALERSGLRLRPSRPDATGHATSQNWALPKPKLLHLNQTPLVVASVQARKTERESCTRGAAGRTVEYLELVHRRPPSPPHSHSIHGRRSSPLPAGGGDRRSRRPLRRRVVRVPLGPGGQRAAEDAGLRVRRRRRLQAHPAERRLLRAGHRQGPLLLRRQQLLPAQQREPAGLRLLRHRHALQQRPERQWLHVPCDPKRRCDKQQRFARRVQPSHDGSVSPQRQQRCCRRPPDGRTGHTAAGPSLLLARRSLPRRVIMKTRRPSAAAVGVSCSLPFSSS